MKTQESMASTNASSGTADVPEGFKMTELGPLPEEWKVVRLGEVGNIVTGKTPSTTCPEYWNGPIPFITPVDLDGTEIHRAKRTISEQGLAEVKSIPKGAILVSCIGYIGKIGLLGADAAATNQQINSVIPFRDKVDNWFLAYALSSRTEILVKLARKTTVPILNKTNFAKVPIPLPPLPEQRAIAHVLRTVQRAKEATDQVIAALKELKKSLMKHLFTYGPVPLDQAAQVPLKETEIGPVPEDWEVVRLGGLVTRKITDGTHKTPTYTSEGIPFITAKDIRNNRLDFSTCRFISPEEHKRLIARCKPERGDILLTKVGSLGSVAKVDVAFEFSIFVQVALIKPDLSKISGDYLKFSLLSPGVQGEIIRTSSQSTMKYIGVGKIAKLPIPIPPDPEQREISRILQTVDRKIDAEEQRKAALEALFKTLLHHLMTGKVRVHHLGAGLKSAPTEAEGSER